MRTGINFFFVLKFFSLSLPPKNVKFVNRDVRELLRSSSAFFFRFVCFLQSRLPSVGRIEIPPLGRRRSRRRIKSCFFVINSNQLLHDHHHALDYWPLDGHNLDLNLVSADDDFCCSTEARAAVYVRTGVIDLTESIRCCWCWQHRRLLHHGHR